MNARVSKIWESLCWEEYCRICSESLSVKVKRANLFYNLIILSCCQCTDRAGI